MSKVAVVTGANKGIGYAIVRGLCKNFKGDVYLTARDPNRGQEAIENLKKEGFHPKFFLLDVRERDQIQQLRDHLVKTYGGLDVLVNNAGVLLSMKPTEEQTKIMMDINYHGVINMCDILFPILRNGARIVHISSGDGPFVLRTCSEAVLHKVKTAKTVDNVTQLMETYMNDVQQGDIRDRRVGGWSHFPYGVSKAGVLLITEIQQKKLDAKCPSDDIIVNVCCPGFVDTDMARPFKASSPFKARTLDEGADTPVYLATLPALTKEPRGQYLRNRKILNWKADPAFDNLQKHEAKIFKDKSKL